MFFSRFSTFVLDQEEESDPGLQCDRTEADEAAGSKRPPEQGAGQTARGNQARKLRRLVPALMTRQMQPGFSYIPDLLTYSRK